MPYQCKVYLNGEECPNSVVKDTKEEAEQLQKGWEIFLKAKGTKNFTTKVVEVTEE